MKKITTVLVMLVVVFFSLNAGAEILDKRQHGKWQSFILLKDKAATTRMSTQGLDDPENTMLILEYYPDTCETPLMQIVYYDGIKSKTQKETTTGSIRVDKRSVFDVEYLVNINDSYIFIYPVSRSMPTIFKDLMAGSVVRFKINPLPGWENSEPIYKRYSLTGFTSAFQRSLKMCQEIREIYTDTQQKNDSNYFDETPAPRMGPDTTIRTKEKDSDYFI